MYPHISLSFFGQKMPGVTVEERIPLYSQDVLHLFVESISLVDGIRQFRKSVRMFSAHLEEKTMSQESAIHILCIISRL